MGEATYIRHEMMEQMSLNLFITSIFIIGDWLNAKVGSQEVPAVTGKFGLGVQNEAGPRLTEFCQESTLVRANTPFNNTKDDSTHRHHHMVNTEIKLITFFAAQDRETLYSQQK